MLLSIFNNGSKTWIILLLMIVWAVIFGKKVYQHYKFSPKEYTPLKDTDAKLLAAGLVGLLIFLLWINSDYVG